VSDKQTKNPLIYLLAGIGIAAVIYGGWTIYQRHLAEQRTRQYLSAPVPSGLPNPLFGTPGPPPPQP
jgi:hypothetical protein